MDVFFKVMLEFILTFVFVYIIYYFVIIRKNKTYDPNHVPVEIGFILIRHKINIINIDYRKMLYLVSLVSSFSISLIVTFVFQFVSNVYLGILYSLLIVIPFSLIGYSLIGNYFEKNSDKK